MKDQESLRYPIGNFTYGEDYSLDDTRHHIELLARMPKELKKLLGKLRPNELDLRYRKGGWSVRQVVHHLADSHMNGYIRMKMAVTEDMPVIKPYEEKAWAQTEDVMQLPVKVSIRLLSALHRRWTTFLESLSEEDLDRGYYHPESQRTILLPEAIALYAWHAQHHLSHIRLVADAVAHPDADESALTAPLRRLGRRIGTALSSGMAALRGNEGKGEEAAPRRRGRPAKTQAPAARLAESAPVSRPDAEPEAPRRRGRPANPETAARRAEKEARAAAGARTGRGRSPEQMAKAREVRMANLAARRAAQSSAEPAEPEAPRRRGRPANPETAARRAEKEARAAAGARTGRGRSPEQMAAMRDKRMAKLAAKRSGNGLPAALGAATEEVRKRGRPAKAAPTEAPAAAKTGRGRTPEQMAAMREKRQAKPASSPETESTPANQPAEGKRKPGRPAGGARREAPEEKKPGRGRTPEQMAAMRQAKRGGTKDEPGAPPPAAETPRRGRKPKANANPVEIGDDAAQLAGTAIAGSRRGGGRKASGSKANSTEENETGPARRRNKRPKDNNN